MQRVCTGAWVRWAGKIGPKATATAVEAAPTHPQLQLSTTEQIAERVHVLH